MPKPLPGSFFQAPLIDPKTGKAQPAFLKWLQNAEIKTGPTLTITNDGQIQSSAVINGRSEGISTTVSGLAATGNINAATKIVGRTEGIGTTVQQLNSTGQLLNTDQIAADGTGSPLTGGKRGFQALDTNNRLANSFRATGVNVSSTPTSATTLSNTGAATLISIAGSSNQFAPGLVSYNSGSVDPGVFGGPNYILASDPTFAGGAVPYSFSTNVQQQTAAEGNVSFGGITTVNGTAKTGGGNTGGTGGTRGGRGFNM